MQPGSVQAITPNPPANRPPRESALRQAAADMEAQFLAEMLTSAGLGKPRDQLSGGIGEDQFGSFLVAEQAKAMVKAGGIGLAEQIFNALKARDDRGN